MTTNKNILSAGVALIALVSLALPVFANANEGDDMGVWDSGSYYGDTGGNYYPDTYSNYYPDSESNYYPDTYSNYYPDTESNYYPDTYSNYYPDTESNYYPDTESNYYPDTYEEVYYDNGAIGNGVSGFGGTSGGFSMPSFGGYSTGGGYSSGGGYTTPTFGSANYKYRETYFPQYVTPSNTVVTTNTNTCTNNSCNTSYVDNSIVDNSIVDNSIVDNSYNYVDNSDNSVKISNSFNNQKKQQKEEYRNDCYGYDYGYNGYNQGYGYGDYGYNDYGYGYNDYGYNDCYVPPAPIAYAKPITFNSTPYITLSQAPYTGLDLGPMGEVLYWTFLVLWCLGAAYLIVVKRVQNKLVAFLNGFLFGSAQKTVTHATHAPAHTAATPAPMVEEGIDSFIKSQISKRA